MNLAKNQSSQLPSSDKKNAKSIAVSTKTNTPKDNSDNQSNQERKQPIPPPSHPRQYRAIGLIQAKYTLTGEQLTQGKLITTDGTEIEAVLLGRVISLVKNHLDLAKNHLWVVYPRTKPNQSHLHVQIVGVWEPETLNQTEEESIQSTDDIENGYFSIRGEVIYFSQEKEIIVIKIKQFPRKEGDKPKFFKLQLKGTLSERPLHHFWDLKVRLVGETLTIEEGTDLGALPIKKKPGFKRGKGKFGSKRPHKSRKPTPRNTKTLPPIKKSSKKSTS